MELAEVLQARLEELGVQTAPEDLRELVEAYPALLAWMRLVEELAPEEQSEE